MNNNKKYFMKLPSSFLDSYIIKELKAQPENSSDMIVIYLHMMLLSISHNGDLIINDNIPYDSRRLSRETGIDQKIVKKTIDILSQEGIIEIDADKTIYMHEIPDMIVSESANAQAMRDKRKEKKAAIE